LGFAKAALIGLDKMRAGVEILFFGVVAAGIGYGIGLFFEA
jgi:VIT1/CCC1 family predicted Fe2+/Mn2+ transporter